MFKLLIGIGILVALILLFTFGIQEYRGERGVMNILRVIYVLTIAAFLIMLVAFGISAFYQPPDRPEYTTPLLRTAIAMPIEPTPSPGTPEHEEWQRQQEEWEEWQEEYSIRWNAYEEAMKDYHRNVFFISYPCGLLFIALGLFLRPRLDVIRPGLLLGGMGTIIYAIAQSDLASEFRFAGVAVGLVVLIIVGYRTLLKKEESPKVIGNDPE